MSDSRPDLKLKVRQLPHRPGVYLMKDRFGETIYVGKAKDLKRRVSSYFMPSKRQKADPKTRALIASIWDFDVYEVRNEPEALILESKLIKQYRPRYNISFRDDKRFMLVRIQLQDPWPRFTTTRLRKEDGAKYFGPFADSGAIKATVEWLNREFGIRSCKGKVPTEQDYKHCHDDLIRNCSAPCIAQITEGDYNQKVMEACDILEGKGKRARLNGLKEEMTKAAEQLNFELAGKIRDIITHLENALNPTRQFRRGKGVPSTVKPLEDLEELGRRLQLEAAPETVECFDISNVSSNHIVASMVRFSEGVPNNKNYRRYRIKTVSGQDDFASMAEVVRRRYARIIQEAKRANPEFEFEEHTLTEQLWALGREGKCPILLPNLVVVDGGKGQLSSAYKELRQLGLHHLPIVGLAKQQEEIFFPNESCPLLLDHSTGALKLMQRIRDEAHRYANNYNELLLRKRIKESILDDCPGMTQKRKLLLLQQFKSVKDLKKASMAELMTVEGIGPKTAQSITEWFAKES